MLNNQLKSYGNGKVGGRLLCYKQVKWERMRMVIKHSVCSSTVYILQC
jgi:hypothetical protein